MNNMFMIGPITVAIGILAVSAFAVIRLGSIRVLAQTGMQSEQTMGGKTMVGNTIGSNMTGGTKGNTTLMPTPEGPPGP
jgi:hypothetical protein